ncbi:MAG: hypothetical protein ABMB14_21080 [Myxococcota bacterium]
MHRWLAVGTLVCPGSAIAAESALDRAAPGLGGEWSARTTFVSGPVARATEVDTLSGAVPIEAAFDPTLRFGVSGIVRVGLPASSLVSAAWGVYRDQSLCDTCDEPGAARLHGSELLGSTDLTLSVRHHHPLGDDSGATLVVRADLVVPASRDALVCNPMYAAPGAGATFGLPAGRSVVSVGVSALRPFYAYDAAPVGRCAPALRDAPEVRTLTGVVAPTPWDGTWFAGSNPSLTGAAVVGWSDLHALIPHAPERLRTEASLGLRFQRNPVDPAVTVDALTGAVEVPPSSRPLRTAIPWSVEAGYAIARAIDLTFSVSNQQPVQLADPGGTFRALPATTAFTAAVTGRR